MVSEVTGDRDGELLLIVVIGVKLGCGGGAREGSRPVHSMFVVSVAVEAVEAKATAAGVAAAKGRTKVEDVSSAKVAEITMLDVGWSWRGRWGRAACALKSFSVMNFGLAAN